ncbi:hypothetical protein Emag_001312 [Eimeria magna]
MERATEVEASSNCISSSSSSSSSSCCSMGGLGENESICSSVAAAGRGHGTHMSPWLDNPLSLYLIHLRLLREANLTLSPEELLALFQLAGARREALLKPLETVSPFVSPTGALALPQQATRGRGREQGGPQIQHDAKGLQSHSRGQQSFRVDPLDVCLLLMSGELSWSDLPLLEALEETAAAAEAAAQQREIHWWAWWPSLLLGLRRRRRGDVWRETAARLQGGGRPCVASSFLSLGLRKKRSSPREVEGGGLANPLLPEAAGVGTADMLGLSEETGVGAFAVSSLTTAASSRGNRLSLRPSSTPTVIPAAAAAGDRGLVGSRSPGGDRSSQLRDGPTAWSRSLEETAGEGGEAVFKAAAATVSRMGNEALALLPHGCQWPWAASSRASAAAVSGLSSASMTSSSCLFQGAPQHPTVPGWGPSEGPPGGLSAANGWGEGGAPHAAEPLAAADAWRASVSLRLRRESRPGGRRRREGRVGPRQKLSPLDPPYDAYALYLHPFSCVGATELPDAEAARAAEVHEVCLDFLGRKADRARHRNLSPAASTIIAFITPKLAEAILRDVILANGFTSVHLVGHSFGGLVAAELCEMLPPGFVTTLILLAPAYFESERQAVRILTALHFPASHTPSRAPFAQSVISSTSSNDSSSSNRSDSRTGAGGTGGRGDDVCGMLCLAAPQAAGVALYWQQQQQQQRVLCMQ